MAPQYSAKHHSNMQCQCVPERTWRTKTVFTKTETWLKVHVHHRNALLGTLKTHKHYTHLHHCYDTMHREWKGRASRYFHVSVWTRPLIRQQEGCTHCPPPQRLPVPWASRSLVIFAKLVKMMLITWRAKRTLVHRCTSWAAQGLFQRGKQKTKKQHAGQVRTNLRQASLHLTNLFTLQRKSVTWIWLIS